MPQKGAAMARPWLAIALREVTSKGQAVAELMK